MGSVELLIKGAKVVDGTGNPGYKADVAISGNKIKAIGRLDAIDAKTIIEANGLVLSPGFIDMHGHCDATVMIDSSLHNMVEQGITTSISGMCGGSPAPVSPKYFPQLEKALGSMGGDEKLLEMWKGLTTFKAYLDAVDKLPLGANMAFCVGHSTIRIAVMGFDDREPTPKEMEQMKALVKEAMESGAIGLSSGLIYPPGAYADITELIELCKVVAAYGGRYITHLRNESDDLLESMEEAIEIGRKTGVSVIISHHKVAGKHNWGGSIESLALVEAANAEGISVTLDQYPYKAGATALKSTIPPKYHEGGTDVLLQRLRDQDTRAQIKADILNPDIDWENLALNCGLDGVLVLSAPNLPEASGKTVMEYARHKGRDPFEALLEIIDKTDARAGAAYFMMDDEDIERIMQHPYTMIGTDGGIILPGHGSHPRARGTFPKVLGRYVREKKVLRLEDAVRKMTSFPALQAGLKNKGLVREGYDADLVLFDPHTIIDRADYQNPSLKNEGIEYVIVQGLIAVRSNTHTGAGAGKVERIQ